MNKSLLTLLTFGSADIDIKNNFSDLENLVSNYIENKIELRNKARTTKDYILSDKIRDELLDVGIDLKDNPDGSTNWSVKI